MIRWTEEQDRALVAGIAAGQSATEIGRQIDKTRAAIIGRCYRLGLSLPGSPGRRDTRPDSSNVVRLEPGDRRTKDDEEKVSRESWDHRVVETWEQRKARRRLEKTLNPDDASETSHWAATFAFETPTSMRAALGVLAGRLADPELFRNIADRLEQTIARPSDRRIGA